MDLQRFFTNRSHKKVCPQCGKSNILLLEACNFCGAALADEDIKATGRDPLVEAVLGSALPGFTQLSVSFDVLVLRHKFGVGSQHLLAVPKTTCYDLRNLRRRNLPLLQKLRVEGVRQLREEMRLPPKSADPDIVFGFCYPSEYNQLHMHIVVPPFSNISLFDRSVFYLLEEVEEMIQAHGSVKPHSVLDPDADAAQLEAIVELDRKARAQRDG